METIYEAGKAYKTRGGLKAVVLEVTETQIFGKVQLGGRTMAKDWYLDGYVTKIVEHNCDLTPEIWLEKPKVDWSLYGTMVRCVAMDSRGIWDAFIETKPELTIKDWLGLDSYHIPTRYAPKFSGDWKDSLIENPNWVGRGK